MIATLVVIAKEPQPGRVKTRLIGPGVTAAQAADLARCALLDTLAALAGCDCADKVILLDGDAGGWLPAGWRVLAQSDGELDERLAAGFDALPAGPALLVGMDTPQVRHELLEFDLTRYDSCLGMAADGGFWAIGFAEPARARGCIQGVPMSRSDTGTDQHRRLLAAGLTVQELPMLTDVDDAASADLVAAVDPSLTFSRQWQAIRSVGV